MCNTCSIHIIHYRYTSTRCSHSLYLLIVSLKHMYFFLDCELFVVHITLIWTWPLTIVQIFQVLEVLRTRMSEQQNCFVFLSKTLFQFLISPLIWGKNHWYKTIYLIRHVIITHIVVVDKSVMVTNLQRQLVTATKFYNNRKDAERGNISFLRHRSWLLPFPFFSFSYFFVAIHSLLC